MLKMKLDCCFTPYTKHKGKLLDVNVGNDILDLIPKATKVEIISKSASN